MSLLLQQLSGLWGEPRGELWIARCRWDGSAPTTVRCER